MVAVRLSPARRPVNNGPAIADIADKAHCGPAPDRRVDAGPIPEPGIRIPEFLRRLVVSGAALRAAEQGLPPPLRPPRAFFPVPA